MSVGYTDLIDSAVARERMGIVNEAGTTLKPRQEWRCVDMVFRSDIREREIDFSQFKNTTPIPVDPWAVRAAEQQIASCEACTPDLAETLFESVLDRVTGSAPETTDYLLSKPARCPNCTAEVRT